MSEAILGLVGVVLGFAGSIWVTRVNVAASERIATRARQHDREAMVRELAAESYVAAVDALQSLTPLRIDFEPDPREAADPAATRAVEQLRVAKAAISKVVALGGTRDLTRIATDTAVALNVVDDAWRRVHEFSVIVMEWTKTEPPTPVESMESVVRHEADRLRSARLKLTGFGGSATTPMEEIDQGNVLEGSLLFRLRETTAALGLDASPLPSAEA